VIHTDVPCATRVVAAVVVLLTAAAASRAAASLTGSTGSAAAPLLVTNDGITPKRNNKRVRTKGLITPTRNSSHTITLIEVVNSATEPYPDVDDDVEFLPLGAGAEKDVDVSADEMMLNTLTMSVGGKGLSLLAMAA
jgi:hypothetical protein